VAHFGLHAPGNAGDTSLFITTRKLVDSVIGKQQWSLEPLWDEVTAQTVDRLNAESKAIVVGGGGVLLRDTNPNSNSGWQWNCPIELLQRIEVPLVVLAVGYNRFRDQPEFDPVFRAHIAETVQRSAFFGLRNYGSIAQLSSYLDDALSSRLSYQPCPTTLLRYLYPQYASKLDPSRRGCVVVLNAAFDRSALRYGDRESDILTRIARAMKWMNQQGWRLKLVSHCPEDATILPWLIRENVGFEEINLAGQRHDGILRFYQDVSVVIGMRGHSQMIPFGLGVPIISLISHDKLGFFLADIGHPEWGIEIHDESLEGKLVHKVRDLVSSQVLHRQQVTQAQAALWSTTLDNMQNLRKVLEI
jgi:polysaccharide pyruvyl transferase WcaK-like protein